jgi:hypothetical protein
MATEDKIKLVRWQIDRLKDLVQGDWEKHCNACAKQKRADYRELDKLTKLLHRLERRA